MFEFSAEGLQKVLEDFYNITKFKIVLYDSDRKILATYPEGICRFCQTVRTKASLAEKCIGCDNIGFDICDQTRKPYIYKCHMSVIEAIAPIYSNEINMGYLMFGQILPPDLREVKCSAERVSEQYGIALTDEMIAQMPVADEKYIRSAVSMMEMCASYLYTSQIIRNNPDIFVYQLKEYIRSHLDTDISIDSLCRHFYISRTKLYKISSTNFGMGITDYIRVQRIEQAKKLLRGTTRSVSQISASVGIADTNYFIRVFKQYEKITPLQYRKNLA